jgi:NADPH:quinone reductase-like Zn-dependent oxidoreductase
MSMLRASYSPAGIDAEIRAAMPRSRTASSRRSPSGTACRSRPCSIASRTAPQLAQSTKAVAYGGQVSLVGALAAAAGGMDFMSMFLSQARFQPIAVGSRRDLEDLCRGVEQHRIRPVIDSVFSFDDAKAGWSQYAGRKVTGKVVIRH